MKTKGHHTCLFNGDQESVKKNSPFLAEHKPNEGKVQFLGTGYYFWDNNLELAKIWGKSHYGGKYAIIEVDFDLNSDINYDLVGNRSHQIDLVERLRILTNNSDNDLEVQELIYFTEDKNNYTIINPKIVICVFDKNALNLQTKKIVFTS